MRWSYVIRTIGALIFCIGLTMLLPLGFALHYKDGSELPLFKALLIVLATGLGLFVAFRHSRVPSMTHREGMAIVALAWLTAGLAGALPFYLGSTTEYFVDGFFESVSGFSTTGASIFTDIEKVPRGILMWRSLTHWLGGMGIIVFSLAILPFLGVGGMQLYKAEVPSPVPDKLRPRIHDTAMVLWKVYLFFTLVETVMLMFGGMDLFESLCHTFGTMATGGFSTKNASIAHYGSAYIDAVITVFMLIAGINFSLHYFALMGRPRVMWKDPEFRFFMMLVSIFTAVSTLSVFRETYASFWESLRHAAFQVASIITTTGYATADYEKWPPLPQSILFFCMFLGASAGSTGGGMKCMRIMLLLKHGYLELLRLIHPWAVLQVKLAGRPVPDEVIKGIWGFFILYLALFILSSFLLAAMGQDILTAFSAVAASIGNIGPGFGNVGPTENYAHLPHSAKWLLALCMLLGRLEIYTVIVLFVPEFWRK
ncbi:TrkH family potassium uptake protein [Desulforhabdus amnigena]|jgi:trk system potassium uptake protein TrkH|uniref:Trk system potassium transporter TrkH n=1 Tax=Desulforhabdus amnigena TaxID=40218 RepID=A0A9W6FRB0_9BACT|nr:TrkH family potassium uptake protein [Desulforhabdus amnigena]NLJ27890.1 TrkH family potassium uptake protein [Deltaproteobacteria bacterium]GLI32793.1 Trk system potassium transporter TrkH [Desulforhabdus amnigena]